MSFGPVRPASTPRDRRLKQCPTWLSSAHPGWERATDERAFELHDAPSEARTVD